MKMNRRVLGHILALATATVWGTSFVSTKMLLGDFSDMIYLLVYAGLGFILAYSYEKSHSIFVPIGIYFVNNAISRIAMFL